MFGLFLVALGTILLLEKMGIIQGDFWGYFWPVLMIVLGFKVMSKDKNDSNCFSFWTSSSNNKDKHKHKKVVDDQ